MRALAAENMQIIRRVVLFVPVLMVYDLPDSQRAAEFLFRDITMQRNITILESAIAVIIDIRLSSPG